MIYDPLDAPISDELLVAVDDFVGVLWFFVQKVPHLFRFDVAQIGLEVASALVQLDLLDFFFG